MWSLLKGDLNKFSATKSGHDLIIIYYTEYGPVVTLFEGADAPTGSRNGRRRKNSNQFRLIRLNLWLIVNSKIRKTCHD